MNQVVQGLWIGDEITAMERLSITSFLAQGHDFDLYVYSPVRRVPEGTRLRDANEILPADAVFQYRDYPSYAGFANFFRYKLLLERGGWWVDMDAVCLKPFDFAEDYVFASECGKDGVEVPTAGFIKAPPNSAIMEELWETCRAKDPANIIWGETGSRLLRQALPRHGLESSIQPSHVFCPIGYQDWERLLEPEEMWTFLESTRSVHLWNEMWRREGREKDATYHPDCLFEQLKSRYGV